MNTPRIYIYIYIFPLIFTIVQASQAVQVLSQNMRAMGKNRTGNMAQQIPVNKKIPASKLDNPAIIKDLMRTNDEIHGASFPQISYKK